jgi:hypothetical protein
VVYEAFDRQQGAVVALKTLGHPSAEALLHLKSEFRSVQDLQHPNLVQLGELIEQDGVWFFTMERVDGTDFVSYVRGGERDALDEAKLRSALEQLARGLGALHGAAKVHRDVKPSNVMVTREGRVVILDFGIVHDLLEPDRDEEDMVLGTASYMSPEQAEAASVTASADWYGAGVMLFQALTGELPFNGTVHELLEAKLLNDAPRASTRRQGIPADLDALCADLLQREPEDRPNGAEVLLRLGAEQEDAGPAASHAIFVGREAELRALEGAFDAAAREKRAVAVLIEGESGVGKSRLAASFCAAVGRAHPGNARLLRAVLRARVGAVQGGGRRHRRHRQVPRDGGGARDELSPRAGEPPGARVPGARAVRPERRGGRDRHPQPRRAARALVRGGARAPSAPRDAAPAGGRH